MSDTIPAALAASRHGGVRVLGGENERRSYTQLLSEARRIANGLAKVGLSRGDRLILVLPTGWDFVQCFFGCNVSGVIPCQVSPPEGFGSAEMFRRRIGDLAALVGASGFVAEEHLIPTLNEAVPGLPVYLPANLLSDDETPPGREATPDDVAFIQFTSGTTREPKGVVIPQRAVATNTHQIGKATEMVHESVVVSWLPMFHDMGLVSWLTSLFTDCDSVLSTPMSFLRRPSSWLRAIHTYGGSHCPAPTFAFRYAAQRVRDKQLKDLDLSSWKTAYVGAEPIPPGALAAFQERFGPFGLAKETLLPCYGMAEATLALTFIGQRDVYESRVISREGLREGRVEEPKGDADSLGLVACGTALEGTSLWIEDDEGTRLGEDALGEVVVDGPSLFRGYYGQEPREGAFHTGDVGFLHDGQLFVTGRKKDLIILRGQNHHPEEVEWVAAQVPGVRMGRTAAFGITDDELGTERLCLLVEGDRKALQNPEALEVELRRKIHEESGLPIDFLMLVEPGTIPVTTSGKVQRAAARQIFLQRWTEGGID